MLSVFYHVLAGLQDLLPGIINQLGPDSLNNLKKLAEQVCPPIKLCSALGCVPAARQHLKAFCMPQRALELEFAIQGTLSHEA